MDHTTHDVHQPMGSTNAMAVAATLHCLTGCAIGEVLGLMIGTAWGLGNLTTIVIAVALAFVFGYALSTLPLLRAGWGLGAALGVVLAADTLSIATMELVDNAVMAAIPGAMEAGLVNPVFWLSLMLALTVAFFAAWPVNRYLLSPAGDMPSRTGSRGSRRSGTTLHPPSGHLDVGRSDHGVHAGGPGGVGRRRPRHRAHRLPLAGRRAG